MRRMPTPTTSRHSRSAIALAALVTTLSLTGCNDGSSVGGLSCGEAKSRFTTNGEKFQRANAAVMAAANESPADQRRSSERLLQVAQDTAELVTANGDCFSAEQRQTAADSLDYVKRLRDQSNP